MIDLRLGDCIEILKTLPDNSVDSIVTDPPYGLSFMNKKWDYDVPSVEVWAECLRVLKPGGHLLSFAGSRTYHRMAVRIEDAGFEIRDQIMWVYGSGFPKSHNIKKQIEKNYLCQFIENAKHAENKLKLISAELIEERTDSVLGNVVILQGEENENKMLIGVEVGLYPTDMSMFVSTEDIEQNTILLLKNKLEENLKKGNKSITSTELKQIIDLKIYNLFQYQNTLKSIETLNGTALKPSHEPICMARKPLSEKSIAENVLKWGTGGINIDGCRIGSDTITTNGYGDKGFVAQEGYEPTSHEGRFPANIMFDEEAGKILDEQSGILKSTGSIRKKDTETDPSSIDFQHKKGENSNPYAGQTGGASRFFYCPKVSKKERNAGMEVEVGVFHQRPRREDGSIIYKETHPEEWKEAMDKLPRKDKTSKAAAEEKLQGQKGNTHPTVKPIKLMEYLIKLVTPQGGVVLEPFMGSGSTGIAAKNLGMSFIGIEKEEEYMEIAKQRINNN